SGTLNTGRNNSTTTFSGIISGSGGLTKAGGGTFTLAAPNSYTGATAITAGFIQLGTNNAIPSTSAVTITVGGNLLLNNFNDSIGSLAGTGIVSNVTVNTRGSGYVTPPTVTFNNAGTGGSGAAATANLTPAVTAVTITNGGSGYTSAPSITFSAPPSGTTATGTAIITGGVVTSVTITNGGSGY